MKRDRLKIATWAACGLIPFSYLYSGGESGLAFMALSLPPPIWLLPAILNLSVVSIAKRLTLAVATLLSLLLGVVLWGGLTFGHASEIAPALKVMTLNAEKFTDHTPAEVAEVIRSQDPDVVCLQEASKLPPPWRPPVELAKLLPSYRLIANGEVAILTRLPVVGTEAIPLGAGPASRPALLTRLKLQNTEITIVCVHLQFFPWDNFSGTNADRAAHNQTIQKEALEQLIDRERGPLMICGDFNSPAHGAIPRMVSRKLTDAYAATNFGFGWTIPSGFPNRRLDYIFAGHGLQTVRAQVVAKQVSDHRPLVATLGIR